MKPIRVIPLSGGGPAVAAPGLDLLESLAAALARRFRTPCQIRPEVMDISSHWHAERQQYHSTAILRRLEAAAEPGVRVLGVTSYDLYVPVLTFVFGEAQLEGNCAVLSLARLREEFYGLPRRDPVTRERLLKVAVHELGHTFGLRHCPAWECVMSSSYGVERLDVKSVEFCPRCARAIVPGRAA